MLLIFILFPLSSEKNSAFASQHLSQDSAIQKLQEDSQNKIDTLLKDKEFHDIVLTLEPKASCSAANLPSVGISKDAGSLIGGCQIGDKLEGLSDLTLEDKSKHKNFYIFVSFSLGEKALLNLAQDAKRYGATLVLRGFKTGSHVKTVHALQKIIEKTGQGFIIDPELFTLFAIQAIPTFVLSKPFHLNASERIQTPLHDQIQGHVSVQYALETFAKEGDLKDEAKSLLLTGETK
jgi:type-F conjugative transfer system pilin assembly protein TrbC